jgi:hypothetical protein|nr:MAG TPA: hypothetical protein [Caudoviricetes sp.]
MRPTEYIEMTAEERAFIIGAIDIRTEEEEKARREAERKGRKR